MSDIKIIALGGVRENAKNLYIVEINDSIFILDAGLKLSLIHISEPTRH